MNLTAHRRGISFDADIDSKRVFNQGELKGVNCFWKDLIGRRGPLFFFKQFVKGIRLIRGRRMI